MPIWATLHQIADSAWVDGRQFSPEVWHLFFRRRLLSHVDLPDGTTMPVSTTTLDQEHFGRYLDQVGEYAVNELGVEIGVAA